MKARKVSGASVEERGKFEFVEALLDTVRGTDRCQRRAEKIVGLNDQHPQTAVHEQSVVRSHPLHCTLPDLCRSTPIAVLRLKQLNPMSRASPRLDS